MLLVFVKMEFALVTQRVTLIEVLAAEQYLELATQQFLIVLGKMLLLSRQLDSEQINVVSDFMYTVDQITTILQ